MYGLSSRQKDIQLDFLGLDRISPSKLQPGGGMVAAPEVKTVDY